MVVICLARSKHDVMVVAHVPIPPLDYFLSHCGISLVSEIDLVAETYLRVHMYYEICSDCTMEINSAISPYCGA